MVVGLVDSLEYRTRLVRAAYLDYLGRPADAAGEAYWLSLLAAGYSFEQVLSWIIGSDEYAGLQTATF